MERINCRTSMTQIGRGALPRGGRWCSWVMRWKTCRPLRRRAWLASISVSGKGRPRGRPNVSRDRASDWGAHCRFDPGSARQLAMLLRAGRAAVRAVADEASQDVLARSIRRPRRPSPFGNPRVCAFVVQVFHIARLASLKCDFVHAKRHCLDLLHIWRKSP
jgi:hypothetical protein